MGFFWNKNKKQEEAKTVLLLDVESGSVGAALARISKVDAARLFGQIRVPLPVADSPDSAALAAHTERAAREVLLHASEVAARLRGYRQTTAAGDIQESALFLSAPWMMPGNSHPLGKRLGEMVHDTFELSPSLHQTGSAAAHAAHALSPEDDRLLCVITGEVAELLLVHKGEVVGRATMPAGKNALLRTLRAHAGLSFDEARSALVLQNGGVQQSNHLAEPFAAAARHFAEHFKSAATELLAQQPANTVFVIAEEPIGEWLARTLPEEESLAELFPHSGVVRRLRESHLSPYLLTNTTQHDIFLMLEALYLVVIE